MTYVFCASSSSILFIVYYLCVYMCVFVTAAFGEADVLKRRAGEGVGVAVSSCGCREMGITECFKIVPKPDFGVSFYMNPTCKIVSKTERGELRIWTGVGSGNELLHAKHLS